MRVSVPLLIILFVFALSSCVKPRITLFPDSSDEPLEEYVLEGAGKNKVLLIPVRGFISDSPKEHLLSRKPAMVQEIVSQLRKAEKDKDIKAVLLKVDSPGGSITASDILYHEIMELKKKNGVKIVAALMGVAASGGYYISLPADFIIAHPTTVTGSIGVIFIRPNMSGLMGKLGLNVEIDKYGKNKDMGSPYRQATDEERQIMKGLIDELGGRFAGLVAHHRRLTEEALDNIRTARVYLGEEALRLGLVDRVGYLDDAVSEAKKLTGDFDNAKVVVYRRAEFPDDTLYNSASGKTGEIGISLVELALPEAVASLRSGFYYLWLPAAQ